MRRREFIALMGATVTWPFAAMAQRAGRTPRVGYLGTNIGPASLAPIEAFREGLRELGYIEGQNIIVEYRWAQGPADAVATSHAAELVGLGLDLAVAANSNYVSPFRQASSTIPIVFCISIDPVAEGIVASLGRPGGNSSGLSIAPVAYWGKALELLTEAVPRVRRIGVISDPFDRLAMAALEAAARSLAVELRPVPVTIAEEFSTAFAAMIDAGAEAVLLLNGAGTFNNRARVAALALKHHLPSMFGFREGPEAGGLLSYGPDINAAFRRCAVYVDKIIKGAKPSELPVEQTTVFVLTVNLNTAKALGLEIPTKLLALADEVIE
jgi:putative tryptophan/tyrosine transport system substrate-binding protein